MTDVDAVLEGVGPRLRALRVQRGETLASLAATTGISVSTLSRLESGRRRPTLELLLPLARAHQVALDELVDAPETGDPRVRLRPVVRGGRTFLPLTRRPGGLQAYKVLLPADAPPCRRSRARTRGTSGCTCCPGRLRLVLGGRSCCSAPGEVVEFDTRTPHRVGNHGRAAVEVLAMFGPQGERMHVR